MNEEGHTVTTFSMLTFTTTHTSVMNLGATDRPVVRGEDKESIISRSDFSELFTELTDVVIDIGNHTKEGRNITFHIRIHIDVFLWSMERAVRGVGGNVGKEWFFSSVLCLDKLSSLIKKYIRAETLRLHRCAVLKIGIIKVRIVPKIRSLANTSTSMDIGFLKATVLRLIGVAITKVPFSEDTRYVARLC